MSLAHVLVAYANLHACKHTEHVHITVEGPPGCGDLCMACGSIRATGEGEWKRSPLVRAMADAVEAACELRDAHVDVEAEVARERAAFLGGPKCGCGHPEGMHQGQCFGWIIGDEGSPGHACTCKAFGALQ